MIQLSQIPQSSCDCDKCKTMCHRAPCLGTPQDMAKIILAGFGNDVLPTSSMQYHEIGLPPTKMLAPRMTESGCAFLDEIGRCRLHSLGLKPTEGKLAHHALPLEATTAILFLVRETWTGIHGNKSVIGFLTTSSNAFDTPSTNADAP